MTGWGAASRASLNFPIFGASSFAPFQRFGLLTKICKELQPIASPRSKAVCGPPATETCAPSRSMPGVYRRRRQARTRRSRLGQAGTADRARLVGQLTAPGKPVIAVLAAHEGSEGPW